SRRKTAPVRLRAREDRHRRRPLADGRLREPERAFALQRLRAERRRRRRTTRHGRAEASLGGAPRVQRARARRARARGGRHTLAASRRAGARAAEGGARTRAPPLPPAARLAPLARHARPAERALRRRLRRGVAAPFPL